MEINRKVLCMRPLAWVSISFKYFFCSPLPLLSLQALSAFVVCSLVDKMTKINNARRERDTDNRNASINKSNVAGTRKQTK